jgi:hypothetical protein
VRAAILPDSQDLWTLTSGLLPGHLLAMLLPPDRAWQVPWLWLNLLIRDVIAVPWGKDW